MEAPEKIYVDNPNHDFWYRTKAENSIEYTRTDAFIEKTCRWLKEQEEMVGVSFEEDFIERFKKYMEGE